VFPLDRQLHLRGVRGGILLAIADKRQSERSVWEDYRRHSRPIILDGLLFLTTLAILLVGFVGLKVLEAAGYPASWVEFLESVHYVAYASITILFAFDMFMKVVIIVTGGAK
jgi:hypothetical protein